MLSGDQSLSSQFSNQHTRRSPLKRSQRSLNSVYRLNLKYAKVSTGRHLRNSQSVERSFSGPRTFYLFIYFAHTNNYNTLHLQFITGNCYRLQKRNKKKKKDKVHKNTIVYILTIKRTLPALWSSITHLPVCRLYFN